MTPRLTPRFYTESRCLLKQNTKGYKASIADPMRLVSNPFKEGYKKKQEFYSRKKKGDDSDSSDGEDPYVYDMDPARWAAPPSFLIPGCLFLGFNFFCREGGFSRNQMTLHGARIEPPHFFCLVTPFFSNLR